MFSIIIRQLDPRSILFATSRPGRNARQNVERIWDASGSPTLHSQESAFSGNRIDPGGTQPVSPAMDSKKTTTVVPSCPLILPLQTATVPATTDMELHQQENEAAEGAGAAGVTHVPRATSRLKISWAMESYSAVLWRKAQTVPQSVSTKGQF